MYNAFNVYCRELAPGTVSLTGYRAQGDDGKHCAYCTLWFVNKFTIDPRHEKPCFFVMW